MGSGWKWLGYDEREMEMDSHPHHLSDQQSPYISCARFLLKERMPVRTQSMTVRHHNRQMRRKVFIPNKQHIATPGAFLAMKFEHCAGAGQFPASLVKPRSFHQVGHPQVSGVACFGGPQKGC